jgi:hypothetical protein
VVLASFGQMSVTGKWGVMTNEYRSEESPQHVTMKQATFLRASDKVPPFEHLASKVMLFQIARRTLLS